MDSEVRAFYPFHARCGCTLAVVSRGKDTVPVVASGERPLEIPMWMMQPPALGYAITEKPTIDLRGLLALSPMVHPGSAADHATLFESETIPSTGGEDEALGAGARCEAPEGKQHSDGRNDEGEAAAVDGATDTRAACG